MKAYARQFIYDWVPPAAIRAINSLLDLKRQAPYEFIAYEWPLDMQLLGWQANSVNETRERTWDKFLQLTEGQRPLGISENDLSFPMHISIDVHNLYLSFGYCLALACHNKQVLTILDWGGATGNYYIISKKLMPAVKFDYHCADLPSVCEIGRKLLPEVVFYESETWQEIHFDFVFSSSSLQYLKDWRSTVRALVQSSNRYMYITRMPFVVKGKSFVMLQRAKEYGTEYLGWVLNRQEFIRFVEQHGMKLVREFVNHRGPRIKGAPEQNLYMGFLFEK